jgi:hypothetical protein
MCASRSMVLSIFIAIFTHVFKDLIEMTIKKLDLDRDGKVSFSDFETTVKVRRILYHIKEMAHQFYG